jgi:hypothetical protein
MIGFRSLIEGEFEKEIRRLKNAQIIKKFALIKSFSPYHNKINKILSGEHVQDWYIFSKDHYITPDDEEKDCIVIRYRTNVKIPDLLESYLFDYFKQFRRLRETITTKTIVNNIEIGENRITYDFIFNRMTLLDVIFDKHTEESSIKYNAEEFIKLTNIDEYNDILECCEFSTYITIIELLKKRIKDRKKTEHQVILTIEKDNNFPLQIYAQHKLLDQLTCKFPTLIDISIYSEKFYYFTFSSL